MNNNLNNPFYYLENFRFVLTWVLQRYADLLDPDELAFIHQFSETATASQALLVRMIMRRGNQFRLSKLQYPEIGDALLAAQPLIANGWLSLDPLITLEQLYGLLTKPEFAAALQLTAARSAKKTDLLTLAQEQFSEPCRFSELSTMQNDALVEVKVDALCDRFRLMFFGNLYQDWSEFVLADLGIFTYEKVAFSAASRAFHDRADIHYYLHLHRCRITLEETGAMTELELEVDALACSNPWLLNRREKLLFQIAQEYERQDDHTAALNLYARCRYAGARLRQVRMLEKLGQTEHAHNLATMAAAAPESAEESQNLERIVPRLQRKLGQPVKRSKVQVTAERIDLVLPRPAPELNVEEVAREHIEKLDAATSVFYVENALINSLFGLLCWEAIFCSVPGAFFHPFQSGPADLHSANFRVQRAGLFQQALSQLSSQQYQQTIRASYARKAGIQSPFVYWETLTEELLELALACIPASHLAHYFERILDGIAANRSGFPDLIQFWPQQQRYRMIEVKGPGDRLQDNQIRFLDFCHQHAMPVAVCYVEWQP